MFVNVGAESVYLAVKVGKKTAIINDYQRDLLLCALHA